MASKRKTKGKGKEKADISDRPCLAFTILSETQTNILQEIDSPDDLESKVRELLNVQDTLVDVRQSALLDYFVLTVQWAKDQAFTAQQFSGFFTLCHILLDNVREKHLNRVENLKELRRLLAGVGVENPEITSGLDFFTVDHCKDIVNYLTTSFFQHYSLYEAVFRGDKQEEIIGLDLDIEVPKSADIPWPPPLDEAVSEYAYQRYVLAPTASTTSIEAEEEIAKNAERERELAEKEAEIISKLTSEEIKQILDSVCKEMLGEFEDEVAQRLRDREASFIARFNKLHRVS